MGEPDELFTISRAAVLMGITPTMVNTRIFNGSLVIADDYPLRISRAAIDNWRAGKGEDYWVQQANREKNHAVSAAAKKRRATAEAERRRMQLAKIAMQEARRAEQLAELAEAHAAADQRRAERATAPKAAPRTSLNIMLRAQVLARDGLICRLCGHPVLYASTLAIDHIIPVSRGGDDSLDNLQVAHRSCNSRKGDRDVSGLLPYSPETCNQPRPGEQPLQPL